MSTPTTADSFLELIKTRRTYYQLNKELPVSTARVEEVIKDTLLYVPSSFNSQSNRIVVLFGADHEKFWDLVSAALKPLVPEANWGATATRMAGFKAGAGTVLFYEDQTVVEKMQATYAIYADKFPIWAMQSDGMLQLALWVALEADGLGANLQHYNPVVDAAVTAEWNIPATWQLNAQLVFGGRAGEAGPKDFKPIEELYKVFGQ